MFKADDYRLKIQGLRSVLDEAGYALDLDNQRRRLAELRTEQEQPEVWQDLEKSAKIGREISHIENKISAYEKGETALKDATEVVGLIEETEDESLIPELDSMLQTAEKDIEDILDRAGTRMKRMTFDILVSSRLDGLSHKEIAEKYGISQGRVAKEIMHAMKIMKKLFKDYLHVILPILLLAASLPGGAKILFGA